MFGITRMIARTARSAPSRAPATRNRDLFTVAPSVDWATTTQVTTQVKIAGQARPSMMRYETMAARAPLSAYWIAAVLWVEKPAVSSGVDTGASSADTWGPGAS